MNTQVKETKSHQFHLVNPSPWPIFASFATCMVCFGAVLFFHDVKFGKLLLPTGFLLVLYSMYVWWRDVIKEAKIDKAHTLPVQTGLKMGMALFILSEIMFFFAFFFAFFHSSVFPAGILEDIWPVKAGVWPPENVQTVSAWDIPFLNTLILLLSGTTVTWAHHSLLNNKRKELIQALTYTVALGVIFSGFQAYEYYHILHEGYFKFSNGIYGANFFMATGFHGFHVLVGTIFLAVCLIRAKKGDLSEKHHLGFEFAAWYWHFVDAVWLFLFAFIYVWGA